MRNSLAALVLLAAVMLGAVGKPVAADDSILTQQMLTGDWAGTRTTLKHAGIDLNLGDARQPGRGHQADHDLSGAADDDPSISTSKRS